MTENNQCVATDYTLDGVVVRDIPHAGQAGAGMQCRLNSAR